jgi:hypothetical protein
MRKRKLFLKGAGSHFLYVRKLFMPKQKVCEHIKSDSPGRLVDETSTKNRNAETDVYECGMLTPSTVQVGFPRVSDNVSGHSTLPEGQNISFLWAFQFEEAQNAAPGHIRRSARRHRLASAPFQVFANIAHTSRFAGDCTSSNEYDLYLPFSQSSGMILRILFRYRSESSTELNIG